MRSIKELMDYSYYYKLLSNRLKCILFHINPEIEIKRAYRKAFGVNPNLKEPNDLIEKIYYMELNCDVSLWTQCADKYRMRDYIEDKGLSHYLPKLLGVWNTIDEIDISPLPNEFVLKANNGCGDCLVVKNKQVVDIMSVKKHFKKYRRINIGYDNSQIHYLGIKPCIIAEELLHQDETEKVFSPTSLVDYKMWCINGQPESVWVAYNRHNGFMVNMALFDVDWNPMPQFLKDTKLETYKPGDFIPKPVCLNEMIEVAKKIAAPFPELRLDFYVIDGRPYIGEMTFTSGYGFFTYDYYKYLGQKVLV